MAKGLFLPAQPWELAAAGAGGLTLSQFRFFVSFMLSVAVGAVFRATPTARGGHGSRPRTCSYCKEGRQHCASTAIRR